MNRPELRASCLTTLFLLLAATAPAATVADSVVVPVAARAAGGDGSFWRTDLVIENPAHLSPLVDDADVLLTLELIPTGVAGSAGARLFAPLDAPLRAGETRSIDDVLSLFPGATLGALVVHAVDAAGNAREVLVSSRTWTPAPGAVGSFGQGIPGSRWAEAADRAGEAFFVPGVELSERFRTNLGIANLSPNRREVFTIDLMESTGTCAATLRWTLEPWAHLQSSPLAEAGLAGDGYTARVRLAESTDLAVSPGEPTVPAFAVYGSRVDRATNDPAFLEAVGSAPQRYPARGHVVPAAAHAAGGDGSSWRTDLFLANPSIDDGGFLFVTLELVPSGTTGSAANRLRQEVSAAFPPGGSMFLEDVLGRFFPGVSSGALVVTATDTTGAPRDLVVSSRTWTPSAPGGGFGQGIPAIPWTRLGDPRATDTDLDRQVVAGIESSDRFRTNVGVVNASLNRRESFAIEVWAPDGSLAATDSFTLEPWAHLQRNDLLGALGLSGGGYTAVVRLVSSEDLGLVPAESHEPAFAAYGSRIDRATNDPAYLRGVAPRLAPVGPPVSAFDFAATAPWYQCGSAPWPADAVVVRAFDQAWHWFGSENHREIRQEVDFPRDRNWSQVGLWFKLECPESGKCDIWDRSGSLQLLLNPEAPAAEARWVELARHVTPYRMGMCEYVDVTPLASLLVGRQTLESWIDTWVGPGSSSGEGWRVTFDFVFYPGPRGGATKVLDLGGLSGRKSITLGNVADGQDVDAQTPPVTVPIPPRAKKVEARLVATGHGFGTSLDCAEFCQMRQDVFAGEQLHSSNFWRSDCTKNPVSPQAGTWKYARNGWCPGSIVVGREIDLTPDLVPSQDGTIDFDTRLGDGTEYKNSIANSGPAYEWVSLALLVWE